MVVHLQDETEVVAKARAGDPDAFTTLVNQYDRYIYGLALRMTGNCEDAEDVMQEAFIKAYEHLGKFREDARFYTWLVRIAVNEALMKLRKNKSAKHLSLDEPLEMDDHSFMPREIEDWADNPEEQYATAELQKILAEAIDKLEPQNRIVFVLRDVENFSTDEAASMLGLSVPAVKSRLLRGRLQLREDLNRYFRKG